MSGLLEFSRPLPVDRIPPEGVVETLAAEAEERAALAARLAVPALHGLTAELRVEPWKRGGYRVRGTFAADLEQVCVVTLEPFRHTIGGAVDRLFVTAAEARRPGGAEIVVSLEEDEPDLVAAGAIELGELVAEELALALDPYPRAPGASFEVDEPAAGDQPSEAGPFAALKGLKLDR